MPRKFHKIRRFLFIGVFVTLLLIVPTSQTHADVLGIAGAVGDTLLGAVKSLIETAVFGMMNAFTALLVLFLQFMGGILKWVMSPDFNNGIIRQPFVQQGWAIVRDFANMFFVVILVIIAIATILRQENLGIRRTLPTLIIIALLVNFSLVLVGFVVDVSQIFMIYFLGAFDDKDFATVLVNATNFDDLFSNTGINWDKEMGDWEELGIRFVLKAMRLLALTFAVAVVALLAVLFVIRTVILWVVAILAPLAFVSYILPASRGLWNSWLKQLTNWALFGPAAVFFLFLAGLLMENMSKTNFGEGAAGLGDLGGGSEFMGHGAPFLQAAVIFTFIFLAINAAKMFTGGVGNMVASKIEGWRRGAVSGVTGFAGRRATGVGVAAGRAARRKGEEVAARATQRPAGWGAETATKIAKGEHVLGRLPLFGWAARAGARVAAAPLTRYEERAAGLIDEREKQAGDLSEKALHRQAQTAVNELDRIAFTREAAKRGKLGKEYGYKDEDLIGIRDSARRYERHKELDKARPDIMTKSREWQEWERELAGRTTPEEFAETRKQRIADHMKKFTQQDYLNMAAEAWDNELVQQGFARTARGNQLSSLAQNGTNAQVEGLEKAILNMTRGAETFEETMDIIRKDVREGGHGNEGLAKALETNLILSSLNIRPRQGEKGRGTTPSGSTLWTPPPGGPKRTGPRDISSGGTPPGTPPASPGTPPPKEPPGPTILPGPEIPPPGGAPPAPPPPRRPPGGGGGAAGGTVRVSNNVMDSIRKTEQGDIPAFLTNDTRRVLRELGIPPAQINKMNPDEAWRRIAAAYREGKITGP